MQRNPYVLALIGMVALTGCGFGGSPSTTLSGTVVQGRAQEAVAGATVSVDGATVTTDSSGKFSILANGTASTLTVSKSGYAASSIQNLNASNTPNVNVIMLPAYDPALPAVAPTVTVAGISDGDTLSADTTITVTTTTADPDHNPIKNGYLSLEVPGGLSGSMNLGRVRELFGDPRTAGKGEEVSFTKADLAAFHGPVDLHIIAYDLNGNRTDVIRHVKVSSAANTAAVVAPTDLTPLAVTWGDNLTFSPLKLSGQNLTGQAAAPGTALWVNLDFVYPTTAPAPRAFELWRSQDGENFEKVYTAAPAKIVIDDKKGTYHMRDTDPALTPGVKVYYQIHAVSDTATAISAKEDVTPLAPFTVQLLSPAQAATGVDRAPIFRWKTTGASAKSYFQVIVLDRTQAQGSSLAWNSDTLTDTTEAIYNIDGYAALAKLQPYHAYEWQLAALTESADKKAVALAADYFNVFGVAPVTTAPMKSGPVNEFVTGGL